MAQAGHGAVQQIERLRGICRDRGVQIGKRPRPVGSTASPTQSCSVAVDPGEDRIISPISPCHIQGSGEVGLNGLTQIGVTGGVELDPSAQGANDERVRRFLGREHRIH